MTRREWFRELRARMGMSQRQFADHIGAHYVTVAQWESGRYGAVAPIYRRILNVIARDYQMSAMPED